MNKSAIPKGYKQTEVGVIPEDWNVTLLGRLARSVEYGSSAKSGVKGTMPVLRMGNLQGGKVDWSDLVYTDDVAEISKYFLRPGDVLFNLTNTIELVGKTAIYKGEHPAIFAGYLIRVNVAPDLLDSRFLNYILNTEVARKHSAKVLSVAVGQANINGQKLKTYPIPLPPTKTEQEAIAEALSDADALIESLEQLVAKKRQIKQGTMQELLTGERRLPGFEIKAGHKKTEVGTIPQDWKTTTVREIAAPFRNAVVGGPFGSDLVSNDYVDEGVPVIRGQNMGSRTVSVPFAFVTPAKASSLESNPARPGDLVFTQRGTLGQVSLVPNHPFDRYLISQSQMKLSVNRMTAAPVFFYYVFCSSVQQAFIRQETIQTGVPHINLGILRAIPAQRPSFAEQVAIAVALSDMDAEIDATEDKLAKTRSLKQGMMQELLTGRIRLV